MVVDRRSLVVFQNALFSRLRCLIHYYSQHSPSLTGANNPYGLHELLTQTQSKLQELMTKKFGISREDMQWDPTTIPSYISLPPLTDGEDNSIPIKRKKSHRLQKQGSKKGRHEEASL